MPSALDNRLTVDESRALDRQRARAAAGRFLIACASRGRLRTAVPVPADEIVRDMVDRLGGAHGVLGLVRPDGWPARSRDNLETFRLGVLRHHLAVLSTLREAGAAFEREDVPWLAIKGPVLAIMYDRPDERSYGDLDLLVPAAFLGRAVGALEAAGATMMDQNWMMVLERMHGEIHLELQGTVIDLHWHLTNQQARRNRFPIEIDSLFARRRMVTVGSMSVPTLDAVDTLVHTSMHAAFAGADRLAWLTDIDRCIRRDQAPWGQVIARSAQWRVGLPLATALWRARRVLGSPVPDAVLRALSPPPWRALLLLTQISAPLERSMPGRSVTRLVARAARESTVATAIELVRRSVAAATEQFARNRHPGTDPDAPSPGSFNYPSGGPAAWTAYLAAAAGDQQCEGSGMSPTRDSAQLGSPSVSAIISPQSRSPLTSAEDRPSRFARVRRQHR